MTSDESVGQRIPLKWSKPTCLKDFIHGEVFNLDAYAGPGVYAWTLEQPDHPEDECLLYIGRATSATTLTRRLRQHYLGQISGSYNIPAEFRGPDGRWSINWDNPVVTQTLASEDLFTQIVRQGFAVTRASLISVAAVQENLVRDVERQLLWDLQPIDTTWGTRSAPGRTLRFRHIGADWATDVIKRRIVQLNKEGRSIVDLGFS